MKLQKTTLALATVCALPAFAKIEMATPFNDGMVLQRGMKVPVWGKAAPAHKVTVEFAGQTKTATACAKGCWRVELDALTASKESREIVVTEAEEGFLFDSTTDAVTIKDVLVGEVWMCSGQSNTDCPIWGGGVRYRDGWGALSLTATCKPFVRLVKTPLVPSVKPRYGYRAEWMKMTPEMFEHYKKGGRMPSAMGYYYALELANALDIPIGLVDSSWGGTNIDAWTPPSGYANRPSLKDVAALPVLDDAAFKKAKAEGVYKGKGIYGGWIQQPSALWNGMVAAYAPMAIRGFIWYQGCHNSGEYQRYCDKMHALYDGWAKEFANPDLKLYFVQLTPWGNPIIPHIQIAQAQFDAEEPHAGMAVINDVGNLKDIHPNDKRTVAKRLALHALRRDYGWTSVRDNSPTLRDVKVVGDTLELTFNDAEGFYVYNADRSIDVGLEVCGADNVWKPAKIKNFVGSKDRKGNMIYQGPIQGQKIVVASAEVKQPKRVRYLFNAPWFGAIYSDRCLPIGAFESK